MSDPGNVAKSLRDRLSGSTEERLGKALSELLENPLLTSALGRAFDAREKASQAQEVAMGALNIPSAADIERLTRRLRSVSHRLEGIEEGIHQLGRSLSATGVQARLSAIEAQLESLNRSFAQAGPPAPAAAAGAGAAGSSGSGRSASPSAPRARKGSSRAGAKAAPKRRSARGGKASS